MDKFQWIAKNCILRSVDDVYDEIIELYNISNEQGFEVGQALYQQCAFFTDYQLLLRPEHQNTIKEYNYCKTFSCSPYPTMQETPAKLVDDFMIIEEEIKVATKHKQKEDNVKK